MITGTYFLTLAGFETDEIRSLIQRRRQQLLVHSCIYYRLGQSIVSDNQWDMWAKELVELQKKYPKICERVDYHREFKDFDGSTGFDLPMGNPEILSKALKLLEYHERRKAVDQNGRVKKKRNRVPRSRQNNKKSRNS